MATSRRHFDAMTTNLWSTHLTQHPYFMYLEAWAMGAAAYDHGGSTSICNFPLFFMQVCVVLRHKRHKALTAILGPI